MMLSGAEHRCMVALHTLQQAAAIALLTARAATK
jgi:hypothetical protein